MSTDSLIDDMSDGDVILAITDAIKYRNEGIIENDSILMPIIKSVMKQFNITKGQAISYVIMCIFDACASYTLKSFKDKA